MSLSASRKDRLHDLDLPSTRDVIDLARGYMARADLTVFEFAERVGYAYSSTKLFLSGRYNNIASDDTAIRAAICDCIERHPIGPRSRAAARLFETENVRIMRRYFTAAVERGEISLIYGPPGTQKSFVLEHFIAELNRQKGKAGSAIYVYSSTDMTPQSLIRRIGREAGVAVGAQQLERSIKNLIEAFTRNGRPPAIVIDEAQHLGVHALEAIREVYDRAGCGIVLAGSHDLFDKFLRSRSHLEQWLSRIDHKEPLPGLLEKEVREIAEAELNVKLNEKAFQSLLDACRVDDIFARGADGRSAPRKYYSVRRLVKVLAQTKSAKEKVA